MKNVIVIDFAFTSETNLKNICQELQINFDVLNAEKGRFKFYKVWIDTESKTLIAYTTTKNPSDLVYTNGLNTVLTQIATYQLKPACDLSELTVDAILDKISKYGIGSLMKEEKDFLDEASK